MNTKVATMGQFVTIDFGTAAQADAAVASVKRMIELSDLEPIAMANRPPEGWSGPDDRGIYAYVKWDALHAEPPTKEGYDCYFVGVHGSAWTRWYYRPI